MNTFVNAMNTEKYTLELNELLKGRLGIKSSSKLFHIYYDNTKAYIVIQVSHDIDIANILLKLSSYLSKFNLYKCQIERKFTYDFLYISGFDSLEMFYSVLKIC